MGGFGVTGRRPRDLIKTAPTMSTMTKSSRTSRGTSG
jgi:hypothetical protein